MEFNNNHRFFIQFMLNKGSVPINDAVEFAATLNPDLSNLRNLKILILNINREIGKQFYKIIEKKCEVTEEDYFLWISTKNDHISKIQSGFTKIQLEYFHVILQEILTSQNYRIRYSVAQNLRTSLTDKLTQENAEKALNQWLNHKYFVDKDAHLYFGPKLISEFETYLRSNTTNCLCGLCTELVFIGNSCESCGKNFHSNCLQKFLESHSSCPNCSNAWLEAEYAPTQAVQNPE